MAPPSLLAHLDASRDSTALSLAYASIGDEGCNSIARFMRENVMLKTIDLRGNNIRADGLVVLAHALRSSSNVVSLCLKWNHTGSHERGVRALCDVLKGNQGVCHLDLRNNKLGSECGPIIGEMLRENTAISHLDLSWNDLGPEGGQAILTGLQANHSLIDCQLSGNRISEDTLHSIAFILRRNRQSAPMSVMSAAAGETQTRSLPADTGPKSPSRDRSMNFPEPGAGSAAIIPTANDVPFTEPYGSVGGGERSKLVQDDTLSRQLLAREQNYTNAEDARFFGEVAEYIDLLQLDVARNKKYRTDAEERERVVTKGFMEREMHYAKEMRELENLLAKAKAEKDDLLNDTEHIKNEIDRVKEEKARTLADRAKLEDVARATADRLRCDIRDGLSVKADLETQIFKVKRRQQEQEEESARLRTYLAKCKEDLDRALR